MQKVLRSAAVLGSALIALTAAFAAGSASAESSLDRIKAAGAIRVGIASDPPFTFQDAGGDWKSFNPELVRKLGENLGVKVEFVPASWTTIVAGLQTNKYNMVGASINATPERQKVIDFTTPYSYTGTSFLVRKDNPKAPKTMDDLNKPDITVAVVTGSDNEEATRQFLPNATVRALPNASVADLVLEIEGHRSDALSTSSYLIGPLQAKYPYYAIPKDENGVLPVGISWAVPKDSPELLKALNDFLDQETKSGDIEKLKQTWLTVENSLK